MSDPSGKAVWGVYGGSTRGSSHLRSGLPNQDSIEKWADPGGSLAILAVSDGHGSASHFRSEIGSRMGVEAAVQALRATPIPVPEGHAQVLAQSIVHAWREAVMAHLAGHPFSDGEWAKLPPKESAQAKAAILANPPVAYGATLLAVLAAPDEILYLQLGDGDILAVDQNGGTTRPVAADARLIANQTTSLCQTGAVEDFRSAHFRSSQSPPPALILVSSDGYANSFLSDEDFLRLGPDYLELLRQYGPEKVQAQLEKILPEASRKGSGDDITLGFIQRMDQGSRPEPLRQPSAAAGSKPSAAPPAPAERNAEGQSVPAALEAVPQPAPAPGVVTSVPSAAPAATEAAPQTPAAEAAVKGAPAPPPTPAQKTTPRPHPESAATARSPARPPGPPPPAAAGQASAKGPQPGPHAQPLPAATPVRRVSTAASRAPSRANEETTRLRRKVFWLKLALAGMCIVALSGAGLAYWRPMWVTHLVHRMLPAAPAPPDMPKPPRGPRSHPAEHRPSEELPRTRDRSGLRFRFENCTPDSPEEPTRSGSPAYV